MDSEREQLERWAAELRAIPGMFRQALRLGDERALRHHPAVGEWSAVEVLGHMLDKMAHWSERVERIASEERPTLPGYDQDAEVRAHAYQRADAAALADELARRCERFAVLVTALPSGAVRREGVHGEFGPLSIAGCMAMVLASVPGHLAQLRAAQEAPAE